MLTTAAGTIAPARALVLGAGVAGLQAIATARRLGRRRLGLRRAARRCASRCSRSGRRFLDLGVVGEETEGGYARELTPEEQARQQEALEERIPDFDIVITTAAIPGRPGAAADPGLGRRADAARLGDRRPRRRDRRQLRADPAGRGRRRRRGHGRRAAQPAEHDGRATRASSTRATSRALLDHLAPGGELALDWERRDHRRRLRHPPRRRHEQPDARQQAPRPRVERQRAPATPRPSKESR